MNCRHSVDIVIVNWNSGGQLRDCLSSIAPAGHPDLRIRRVVVVDNASSDNSLQAAAGLDLPLSVIRNAENRGFAAACNQGARGSSADFILFLNPDTVLMPDALIKPVTFMAAPDNAGVGIAGIQLVGADGTISRSCARFPTPRMFYYKMLGLTQLLPAVFDGYPMEEWDHAESREVDHVMGAFYLVRRPLFEALGGFDERFFVYLEDLDFSLRASHEGWKSYFLATVRVRHKGGGTSEQVKAQRLFYSLRSRILYGYKHFKPWQATCLMLATILVEPVTRMALALARCSWPQLVETASGYARLWVALPDVMTLARERGGLS